MQALTVVVQIQALGLTRITPTCVGKHSEPSAFNRFCFYNYIITCDSRSVNGSLLAIQFPAEITVDVQALTVVVQIQALCLAVLVGDQRYHITAPVNELFQ